MNKTVVKRAGHSEDFDERKLYASVYSSLVALRHTDQEAELVAEKVVAYVKNWLGKKEEVTSQDLLHKAANILISYNEDAAYLYQHHRSIS